jgi:hypothetical protein
LGFEPARVGVRHLLDGLLYASPVIIGLGLGESQQGGVILDSEPDRVEFAFLELLFEGFGPNGDLQVLALGLGKRGLFLAEGFQ